MVRKSKIMTVDEISRDIKKIVNYKFNSIESDIEEIIGTNIDESDIIWWLLGETQKTTYNINDIELLITNGFKYYIENNKCPVEINYIILKYQMLHSDTCLENFIDIFGLSQQRIKMEIKKTPMAIKKSKMNPIKPIYTLYAMLLFTIITLLNKKIIKLIIKSKSNNEEMSLNTSTWSSESRTSIKSSHVSKKERDSVTTVKKPISSAVSDIRWKRKSGRLVRASVDMNKSNNVAVKNNSFDAFSSNNTLN